MRSTIDRPEPHNEQRPHGIYRDRLRRGEGSPIELCWRSNLVVDRCRHLLAAFMKGEAGASGIAFLAVGRGDESWDTAPAPLPQPTDQVLLDPEPVAIEIAPEAIVFLGDEDQPTGEPTARLQVTVSLAEGVPPVAAGETYPLREFGLFGRFGGEDYMIDYVRHPVIRKGAQETLDRTIRLEF